MSHSDNCRHPPHSVAAAPARACPHATCRMPLCHLVQLCSGHPAPESDSRPSSCHRDSGGPVSMSKRGSTTPQHSSHNICAGEGPPAPPLFQSAHPAFYHVICYPTIYNCIKTHALRDYFQLQIQFSGATLSEHGSSTAPSPPQNPATVRYNFMLCLTFCTFFCLGLMLWVLLLLVLI